MAEAETNLTLDDLRTLLAGNDLDLRDGVVWAIEVEDDREEAPRRGLARAAHRIASEPRVYDAIQRVVGAPRTRELVGRDLARAGGKIVLDVGAGTGRFRPLLPASATYVWLDNDPQKLAGFRANWPGEAAIVADATDIPLREKSVDFAVCVAVTHHLADAGLERLVRELARVARERLLLVDAVRSERTIGKLLWRYDRGSHPRSEGELLAAVGERFAVQEVERYSKLHEYVFCSAAPKP